MEQGRDARARSGGMAAHLARPARGDHMDDALDPRGRARSADGGDYAVAYPGDYYPAGPGEAPGARPGGLRPPGAGDAPERPAPSLEERLLDECCLDYDALTRLCEHQRTADPVVVLRTRGRDNLLCDSPRVYKHQLLKDADFRRRIIEHYRGRMGYAWCDIVVLNRHLWHIFLFSRDA
jgi:hypothetical protein